MPTGACGVDCDACRLNVLKICSSCGPATGTIAQDKMAAQLRILGAPCPILACASKRKIHYCPRDCDEFPCDVFVNGEYPFSRGFLSMQQRRRREFEEQTRPLGDIPAVAAQYWDDRSKRNLKDLCANALAQLVDPDKIVLRSLEKELIVDVGKYRIMHWTPERAVPLDDPLLEVLCLLYVLNAGPEAPTHELAGVHDLKNGEFFKGPHRLNVSALLQRYGTDLEGFTAAASALGGESVDLADVAYRFRPFPKVPVYYLLWAGDDEFAPRLRILFDRGVDRHLSADALWALTNLISSALLKKS